MDHQLIVFIVVGVIAFFNWLIRKGNAKGGTGRELPPFPRGQIPRQTQTTQSEEERLRKFMEALGVPNVSEPPKKIARPPQIPQQPRIQPPYRKEFPKPVVPKVSTPPPAPLPVPQVVEPQPPVWETPASATPDIPVVEIAGPVSTERSNAADFRSLLRSPSSLRTAIILKEILGPPKSLQTLPGAPGLL